jgi:hypothetical protein
VFTLREQGTETFDCTSMGTEGFQNYGNVVKSAMTTTTGRTDKE